VHQWSEICFGVEGGSNWGGERGRDVPAIIMPNSYCLPRITHRVATKPKSGRVVRKKKRPAKKSAPKKTSAKKNTVVRDSPKIFRA